ncbi:hypothetical protein Y032_0008g283 [Ancylostoma ceylanicum]|uniref:Uncharacterized protein n=1 Tax=Ancylostoma ceylanicum TaxID=53326 RepID=A0A016VLW3_9BILA|nr:hypothetical protein Y032_0008g283 [Ancylostoma ceylanicum]
MYWVILETICAFSLVFISVIKCSDGKKGEERRSAGGPPQSEGQKSAKIERSDDHKPQKSTDSKPNPPPADKGAPTKSNIISKSNMPDDGYEACPDLNSKQLRQIAAET